MNKTWTDEERQVIKNFAHMNTDEELTEKIQAIRGKYISVQAVRKQRQALGIRKSGGRGVCHIVSGFDNLDDRQLPL